MFGLQNLRGSEECMHNAQLQKGSQIYRCSLTLLQDCLGRDGDLSVSYSFPESTYLLKFEQFIEKKKKKICIESVMGFFGNFEKVTI